MYSTLEDIQLRKNELKSNIQLSEEKVSTLWHDLVTPPKASSKGELFANLVTNSVTAIDAFLVVRKLMKSYSYLFGKRKKKS